MAVVEHQRIVSLTQRRRLAMCVDIVALLHVLQYLVEVGGHALCFKLLEAALGAYLGRSGDENLQFGVGEHHRSYVASVHHDALLFAHSLLLLHEFLAYERQRRNRTHVLRHLQCAYVALHALAVEAHLRQLCLAVQLESELHVGQQRLQSRFVDIVVCVEYAVAHGEQRHGTVHGARVNVYVSHFACKILCHCALAAR